MTEEAARAFVPGHVTGFFTIERGDDPIETGSRGAGVALSDGVTVEVRPTDDRAVYLDDTSIDIEPVERVLDALRVDATVLATTELPVGAGFGVSGAVALGTALAVNDCFDRSLSENELITIAHGAEVQSGTGLGDVVAQANGGFTIRLDPGGPSHNTLDRIPMHSRVEYLSFGERSTAAVLDDNPQLVTEAGRLALSQVVEEPTLEEFMHASRRFARETGLLTEELQEVVQAVTDVGGSASMAMLGETVFALGTGLSDAGYDPTVCAVDRAGATMLSTPDVDSATSTVSSSSEADPQSSDQ